MAASVQYRDSHEGAVNSSSDFEYYWSGEPVSLHHAWSFGISVFPKTLTTVSAGVLCCLSSYEGRRVLGLVQHLPLRLPK